MEDSEPGFEDPAAVLEAGIELPTEGSVDGFAADELLLVDVTCPDVL